MTEPLDLVWQQLHWPPLLAVDDGLQLVRRIVTDTEASSTAFEVRSDRGRISHVITSPAATSRGIAQLVRSHAPGVTVTKAAEIAVPVRAAFILSPRLFALRSDRIDEASRAVLAALAGARFRGEKAVLQVCLGGRLEPTLLPPKSTDPTQGWISQLAVGARREPSDLERARRAKLSEAGVDVVVRLAVEAESDGRVREIVRSVLGALRLMQMPGSRIEAAKSRGTLSQLPRRGWVRLSGTELLGFLGWPIGAEGLPGMPPTHPRLLPVVVKNLGGDRTFAISNAPGKAKRVGISDADSLLHTIALGPTGAGKSTALLNLIVADMKAGKSVVVLDPKKKLIDDILARIPAHRIDDVVVLDPTHVNPVGLNPLVIPGTRPELIADGILGIFKDLFPSAFGPQTSDLVHASLLTLAHHPSATLVWLPKLLSNPRTRRELVASVKGNEELEDFWAYYDGLSERQQAQHMGPVLSRLRQFLLRPSLKNVLDQREPRFALGDLFTSPKILLVPINTGILGNEAAKLLGSLLVSQLWQLTLARVEPNPPVSIFVDEVQEFLRLGADLSDALARSRSLGVGWHLAHQFRDQLAPDMRAAIDANALNKIVFGLDIADARAMAAMAPELTAEDFQALPKHAIYARLMHQGQKQPWLSADTLPEPPRTSDPVEILALSQERYGRLPIHSEPEAAAPDSRPEASTRQPTTDAPIGRKRRA